MIPGNEIFLSQFSRKATTFVTFATCHFPGFNPESVEHEIVVNVVNTKRICGRCFKFRMGDKVPVPL